jgi:hypothetical protein
MHFKRRRPMIDYMKKSEKTISKLGLETCVDEKTIEQIAQFHKDKIEIKTGRTTLLFL